MCRRWGWKLILDEVQTCMGRCGTMFAAERFGLEPDLLLLGKGFAGGGQPIAAVLGTEEVMGASDLHLGGTFAWTPAAAAGALASIDAILSTGALENAQRLEAIALEELSPLRRAQSSRWATSAPPEHSSASSSCRIARSGRPAPAFHRAVHRAAVRRGVVGITEWGKWVYRLQPAIDMDPELFRWSCRAVTAAVEEVASDPPRRGPDLARPGRAAGLTGDRPEAP